MRLIRKRKTKSLIRSPLFLYRTRRKKELRLLTQFSNCVKKKKSASNQKISGTITKILSKSKLQEHQVKCVAGMSTYNPI